MALLIREGVSLIERLQMEATEITAALRQQGELAGGLASTARAYLGGEADVGDLLDACGTFVQACRRAT